MSIELTFLGTGGAFTDFRTNYHNNAAVKTDSGYVLIDCGGTAVQSLKELGISVHDIRAVIITHMHGDHVGGLEQLIWERYYTGPNGPAFNTTTVIHALRTTVADFLHHTIDEYTERDGKVYTGGVSALLVEDRKKTFDQFYVDGVKFCLQQVNHVIGCNGHINKPSYGLLIGKSFPIFYTSDMVFSPELLSEFTEPDNIDVDTIFHDCTFSPPYTGTVHTHYGQLFTLPDNVRKRIVLMHYGNVPDGIDVVGDGFKGAARRHETFIIS